MGTDAVPVDAGAYSILDRATLEQQFDRLMQANGSALMRLAASYTNTTGDRDDLVQDIALAIWQALPRFRGECSERTFLFRIAHNRAIAHLARSRSHMTSAAQDIELRDPAPNPESGLAQEERSGHLRQAVYRLPVAYRQLVILTLEGLGYEEIAEVLGITESNVGARLSRARQLLRDLLENRK